MSRSYRLLGNLRTCVTGDLGTTEGPSVVPVASQTLTAPGAMRNVSGATLSSTSLRLSDELPASDGGSAITGIRRTRNDPDGTLGGPWSAVDPPDSRVREFLYLSPGQTYTLTTVAINAVGEGPPTSVILQTTTTAPTPDDGGTAPPAGGGEPTTTAPGNFTQRTPTRTINLTTLIADNPAEAANNTAKLRAACVTNAVTGDLVTVPAGNFYTTGIIDFTRAGIELRGAGVNSTTFRETNPDLASWRFKAGNIHLRGFTHFSPGGSRTSGAQSGQGNLWFEGGHSGTVIEDVRAEGSRDCAFFFYGVHNFKCNRVESRNSGSDAFHISNSSSNGTWFDSVSQNSNDDGMGFVAYGFGSSPHHHNVTRHKVLGQRHGRGLGLIGCYEVHFHDWTLIEGSWAAGIMMACEGTANWGDHDTHDITFDEVRLRNSNGWQAGDSSSASTIPPHGALHFWGGRSGRFVRNITFAGPVVMVDTGKDRTGGAPAQVIANGQLSQVRDISISNASFYGVSPSTKISLQGSTSNITTPGWSNATGVAGTAVQQPAFRGD